MARYIQCPVTHKLIPAEDYIRPSSSAPSVHGDIESFVSPVDGSVITDRKQLREHNLKHGVVSWNEYTPEYLEKQKNKRKDFFDGKSSKQETLKRRQQIYETWTAAERHNN